MKSQVLALLSAFVCAPALAGDADLRALDQCLLNTGNQEHCIGVMSEHCVENMPGGYTTVGMKGCLHAELSYWDGRLNASYKRLRKNDEVHNAETLRDMQRVWIKFRDDKCGYVTGLWGSGTGAGVVFLSCSMDETGRQALFLEALEEY